MIACFVERDGLDPSYSSVPWPSLPAMTVDEIADSAVGLKPNAPTFNLAIAGNARTQSDMIAAASLADQFAYYDSIFPSDFGQVYVRPTGLVSYDSTEASESICGIDTYDFANAFYTSDCDTVAWDRGVMLPEMISSIGDLAPAVVLSHELGHDVQQQLGEPDTTPTPVLEQQADR